MGITISGKNAPVGDGFLASGAVHGLSVEKYTAYCNHCKSHVSATVGDQRCPHCSWTVIPLNPDEARILVPSKP